MSNAPEDDHDHGTILPDLEFHSPGRFAIHNPPSTEHRPDSLLEPAPFVLGASAGLQRSDSPAQLRSHALALIQQARRTLQLYSPDLEPWLYDQREIAEACARLLREHPRNRLQILVRDSRLALRSGHALLRLARQLPSNCQVRRLHPDYPSDDIAFLLADDCGLLLRSQPQLQAGQAHYSDRARVRQLQRQFARAWDTSQSDPDLRSLLL